MKRIFRRIVSLITAAVMVLSLFTVGVLPTAAVDTNDTTVEIGSVADWNEVAEQGLDFAGKTVKLTADINKDGGSVELKTLSPDFKGTFDGNGKTIYNVTATTALIGVVASDATVKDVSVNTLVLTPEGVSGALIGAATNTNISNISVTGLTLSTAATDNSLGGVVGTLTVADEKTVTVSNVKANATLAFAGKGTGAEGAYTNTDDFVRATGGVIGYAAIGNNSVLTVQSCLVEGSISSNESLGAILGYGEPGAFNNTTSILNCESKMALTGAAADGVAATRGGMGMVGLWHDGTGANQNWTGTLNIKNCVNGGAMTSTMGSAELTTKFSTPGGMLGTVSPYRDWCALGATINITNCLLTGTVTTSGTTKGAMVGSMRTFKDGTLNIKNCATTQSDYRTAFGHNYVCSGTALMVDDVSVALENNSAPLTVLTAEQAQNLITRDGDGYITAIGNVAQYGPALPDYIVNYGTQTEWIITSLDEWKIISESGKNFEGKTIKLGIDIDANSAALPTLASTFAGTFDGDGHTISNVVTTLPLVAMNAKGNVAIKNLKVSNVTLNAEDNNISILVREVLTSSELNVTGVDVRDCTITSEGKYYNTALVGIVRDRVNINDCTVTRVKSVVGAMNSLVMGGMNINSVVNITNVKVTECEITSSSNIGAVLGRMNGDTTATLKNVEVTATKVNAKESGLLAGYIHDAHSSLTIEDCIAKGEMSSLGGGVGGAVGFLGVNAGKGDVLRNVQTEVAITMLKGTEEKAPSESSYGGLIGTVSMVGIGSVVVENCKAKITATTDIGYAGGLVGSFVGASGLGSLTIRSCESTMDLTSLDTDYTNGLGGVIGHCGTSDGSTLSMAKIYIYDVALYGNITHTSGEDGDDEDEIDTIGAVGGIVGCCNMNGSLSFTVSEVLLDLEMNGGPVGLVVGQSIGAGVSYKVASLYSTRSGVLGGLVNKVKFNSSVAIAQEGNYTDSTLIVISSEDIGQYLNDGETVDVIGQVSLVKVQVSTVSNNVFNIRFISAFLPEQASGAGYTVTVKDREGTVLKTFTTDACDAYKKLIADNGFEAFTDADSDAYFIAMAILGVPAGEDLTFEISTWYQTADGNIVCQSVVETVSVDAEGAVVSEEL